MRTSSNRVVGRNRPSRDSSREGRFPIFLALTLIPLTGMLAADGGASDAVSKPKVYVVAPEKRCQRITVHTSSGKETRLAPPAPGLRAVALAPRRIRVFWRFTTFPRVCRPTIITLGITRYGERRATPVIARKRVDAPNGAATLSYRPFLPSPDVAFASSIGPKANRYRSRVRMVLIRS